MNDHEHLGEITSTTFPTAATLQRQWDMTPPVATSPATPLVQAEENVRALEVMGSAPDTLPTATSSLSVVMPDTKEKEGEEIATPVAVVGKNGAVTIFNAEYLRQVEKTGSYIFSPLQRRIFSGMAKFLGMATILPIGFLGYSIANYMAVDTIEAGARLPGATKQIDSEIFDDKRAEIMGDWDRRVTTEGNIRGGLAGTIVFGAQTLVFFAMSRKKHSAPQQPQTVLFDIFPDKVE